jgi:tripeptidyl-peptidase I
VQIKSGNNSGCQTNGFESGEGWDPVTGMGSPIYEKLEEVLTNLP